MDYKIYPPEELIEAAVALPPSKSILNRALLINALSDNDLDALEWRGVCEDIDILASALSRKEGLINIERSGTAMRFLTAYYAAKEGTSVVIDGDERIHQRPIGPLVDTLRSLGASIEYLDKEGFAPLRIEGRRLKGGEASIDSSLSSQHVSALLLVAPTMEQGLKLALVGEHIVSEPYIRLTVNMMQQAGAEVERNGDVITVSPKPYVKTDFEVETDWSAATFWYEIEALTMGFLSLTPLKADSLQPDRVAEKIFANLGVVTEFDTEEGFTELCGSPDISPRLRLDMSDNPDIVPALVVASCLLRTPFRLTGVSTLRIKESDRIKALVGELGRIGVVLDTPDPDTLEWEGRLVPVSEMPVFETHNDHRMAMALAPIATYIPGIVVRNAEVVAKSYPGYWDGLRAAGFTLEEVAE